jgi:hypothetical protein
MSRAGVASEISERILGHARPGVFDTYDRHKYLDEKAEGLKRLAALIQNILTPPEEKVVHLFENRHG